MKNVFVLLILLFASNLFAETVIFENSNGIPKTSESISKRAWEESAALKPDGPCEIKKIHLYLSGDNPGKDTLYIVGDPSAGAVSPMYFVQSYNILFEPIIIEYDGNPGWREFNTPGLKSDGYDRIWVQHTINNYLIKFTLDDDGAKEAYESFFVNYNETNSLGLPGKYYLAGADFLLRFEIEYDFPKGNISKKPPYPSLLDLTLDAGLVNENGELLKSAMASVADINSDGFDDIAIGSSFFLNNKDGTFQNISEAVNISATSTVWIDADNDGHLDCFAMKGNGNDKIYWGEGDNEFREITDDDIKIEAPTVTPIWLDYNNDGLVDLFIAYGRSGIYPDEVFYQDKLFKNIGNRQFVDVTEESGIAKGEPAPYYDCWGASVCDFNNDNLPDIFVATYRLAPDLLYMNNGDGTFSEVGAQTGARGVATADSRYYGHGMGSDWGDYNNDGWDDLIVGNLGHPDSRGAVSNPSLIFNNTGSPAFVFTNQQLNMGLKFFEMNAGAVWADLDNDTYLDLVHCQFSDDAKGSGVDRNTVVYRNTGPDNNYKLKDMTWEYSSIIHGAWTPVRLDYDNDGDMDILIASAKENVKLFRNDIEKKANWIEIRTKGINALNHRFVLKVDNTEYSKNIAGSIMNGRAGQSSSTLHFGIKEADSIKLSIYIEGEEKPEYEFTNLEKNMIYFFDGNGQLYPIKMSTPDLILPKNEAYISNNTLNLKWSEVPIRHEYILQISENKDFSSDNIELYIEDESYIPDLEEGKFYYWRVQASPGPISSKPAPSEWSSVWRFYLGDPKADEIELISPKNNKEKVMIDTEFQWKEAIYEVFGDFSSEYELSYWSAEDKSDMVKILDISSKEYNVENNLLPGVNYFWQVRAINKLDDKDVEGEWSETWSFRTLALPDKTILTEPENGATNVELEYTFRWEKPANYKNFELRIAKDSEMTEIFYEKDDISFSKYKVKDTLEVNTSYYWQVRANNQSGNGEWSEVFAFTTTDAVAVKEIDSELDLIISPIPTSSDINIKWDMVVNDCKILVYDQKGKFVKEVYSGLFNKEQKVDLNEFNSGVYIIRFNTGTDIIDRKIVIQK